MSGLFINFEGVDGSGKSTQIEHAKRYLEGKGYEVIVTFEPGGTEYASMIRELVLHKHVTEKVLPMTEVLLFFAARYQHYKTLIEPAIAAGKIILCDRFTPSTIAYQGIKGGVSKQSIKDMHQFVLGAAQPDVTILMDISIERTLKRVNSRGELDRIESSLNSEKIEELRQLYLSQAVESPDDFKIVNGAGTPEEVFMSVKEILDSVLLDKRVTNETKRRS